MKILEEKFVVLNVVVHMNTNMCQLIKEVYVYTFGKITNLKVGGVY